MLAKKFEEGFDKRDKAAIIGVRSFEIAAALR